MAKLKIGKTIYCIYKGNSILTEKVGFIGAESFILENIADAQDYGHLEWKFADYGKTWWTDLRTAKAKLKERYKALYNREGRILDGGDWFEIR